VSDEEDEFDRAQRRLRTRSWIWLVVIVAVLLLAYPLSLVAVSWFGTTGYVAVIAFMLVGYGIARLLLTRGKW
jgi:hypothetical protein